MITESRVLRQVSILPEQNAINVQWSHQLVKDGVVIAETYERKAYDADQKQAFLAEVEGAAQYLPALGW